MEAISCFRPSEYGPVMGAKLPFTILLTTAGRLVPSNVRFNVAISYKIQPCLVVGNSLNKIRQLPNQAYQRPDVALLVVTHALAQLR